MNKIDINIFNPPIDAAQPCTILITVTIILIIVTALERMVLYGISKISATKIIVIT